MPNLSETFGPYDVIISGLWSVLGQIQERFLRAETPAPPIPGAPLPMPRLDGIPPRAAARLELEDVLINRRADRYSLLVRSGPTRPFTVSILTDADAEFQPYDRFTDLLDAAEAWYDWALEAVNQRLSASAVLPQDGDPIARLIRTAHKRDGGSLLPPIRLTRWFGLVRACDCPGDRTISQQTRLRDLRDHAASPDHLAREFNLHPSRVRAALTAADTMSHLAG